MAKRWSVVVALLLVVVLAACGSSGSSSESPTSATSADPGKAAAIERIVEDLMASKHLKAVIVRVTQDGDEVITKAFGESQTGIPATPDMNFRNGAVAIAYVAAVLLQLVDEGKVSLDDTIGRWVPEIPHADEVTLGQLATMTSGYQDYVLGNEAFERTELNNPFKAWTTDEMLSYAMDKPLLYKPGTNWNYAHTNYVILGLALQKITDKPVEDLLRERISEPLGLTNTVSNLTATIPEPTLHAYSSERRGILNLPPDTPFYEETTGWNPSWSITHGAIQTSNIYDVEATGRKLFAGETLSKEGYETMISTRLRGIARPLSGCATCREMNERYTYGMGVVLAREWIVQNPLFNGYAAVVGYLPEEKISIAVAVTYEAEAFGPDGSYDNGGNPIFSQIGAMMAPDHAPPIPRD
ncbi:serine hydrolase domain-containing protein [Gordonia amicalis]|uniref:Serine hydrolase domain-containing protein n=1 Tax=Gordonia amicalis TaxID=89053 RepID=A0ABU4DGT0_9ACTN|nr:serine hydrolase domain-containing protein [Gordonia amicalis]MDJ0453634.1 serine hydrolase domain-containing protein [Gordonia amicalis]MDV6308494.1 serine hydrolase domain-containing protein [Gordonia amicalis]MDV7077456.1 serine hydrolase domain-containing protein [Gordonia amicalis]UOG22763.1 beta-lactamase family protein [Gordonia amicalis]